MIRLLLDKAGSGKTKKMIEMANNDVLDSKGEIVFIDRDNRHMHELHRDIRLIPSNDFTLENMSSFHGFLCGMIGENYDIQKIYVDGIRNIIPECFENLKPCFKELERISSKFDVEIIISATLESKNILSDFDQFYIIDAENSLEPEKMVV